MSSAWAAHQLPDLYPPGTAAASDDKEVRFDREVRAILAAAPPGLSGTEKVALLKTHGFTAGHSTASGELYVFLPSAVAPELDIYLWPEEKSKPE